MCKVGIWEGRGFDVDLAQYKKSAKDQQSMEGGRG